jgi:hypothetical protein
MTMERVRSEPGEANGEDTEGGHIASYQSLRFGRLMEIRRESERCQQSSGRNAQSWQITYLAEVTIVSNSVSGAVQRIGSADVVKYTSPLSVLRESPKLESSITMQ